MRSSKTIRNNLNTLQLYIHIHSRSIMSSKPIVLVTGANGYIAGPVIEAFLKAGYAVRGTVRSKSSADSLVRALSSYDKDLEIVEVPDIVTPGAFDSAVKGKCLFNLRGLESHNIRCSCYCTSCCWSESQLYRPRTCP